MLVLHVEFSRPRNTDDFRNAGSGAETFAQPLFMGHDVALQSADEAGLERRSPKATADRNCYEIGFELHHPFLARLSLSWLVTLDRSCPPSVFSIQERSAVG